MRRRRRCCRGRRCDPRGNGSRAVSEGGDGLRAAQQKDVFDAEQGRSPQDFRNWPWCRDTEFGTPATCAGITVIMQRRGQGITAGGNVCGYYRVAGQLVRPQGQDNWPRSWPRHLQLRECTDVLRRGLDCFQEPRSEPPSAAFTSVGRQARRLAVEIVEAFARTRSAPCRRACGCSRVSDEQYPRPRESGGFARE